MTSTASPAACICIRSSRRGGLVNPDPALRAEAVSIVRDAAAFAGSLGAHLIIWPGGEGYNYPFQTPYADSWRWLIEGLGEAASVCAEHGVKLFLEHKNSEPAMKILMRNIGMMPVRSVEAASDLGLDNVQVNMDWQHLIMNGEHLPEYAALLASEGVAGPPARELRLGHVRRRQHGRRHRVHGDARAGVGAPAVRLRVFWGTAGVRLCIRTPRIRSGAVRRSVLQWQFIDSVAARIDDAALREAQAAKDAVRAYEIVYAALGA